VHLFLITSERAIDDSQMIFVLWKHTLFAAGAKLCDTGKKSVGSERKSRWDRALRLVPPRAAISASMSASTCTRKFRRGEARG
jgi:hypothetical protein